MFSKAYRESSRQYIDARIRHDLVHFRIGQLVLRATLFVLAAIDHRPLWQAQSGIVNFRRSGLKHTPG
jgi:hypothetical protein